MLTCHEFFSLYLIRNEKTNRYHIALHSIILGIYAFNMSILTTEESSENLTNAIENTISGKPYTEIVNQDLISTRTNYVIVAGIISIIGVILIISPENKTKAT
jgi:hypothetical protein